MKAYSNYLFRFTKKRLCLGIISNLGRNFDGHICVHHRFSGNKHQYRFLDFKRRINSHGFVYKIIKDSKWSAFIGNIFYINGLTSCIILSHNLNVLSRIYSGSNFINKYSSNIGSAVPILNLNLFANVNNVELVPFKGSSLSRAAGTSSLLLSKNDKYAQLKLKSGWNISILKDCLCTIGITSNIEHRFVNLKKAGKSRALGFRPSVRGVAMNPCDHPHGGGEGRKSPRKAQVSPWGWLTKNTPSKIKKRDKLKKKLYKQKR